MNVCSVLLGSLLATALAAQADRPPGTDVTRAGDPLAGEHAAFGARDGAPSPDGVFVDPTPRAGLENLASPVVGVRPERVAPGAEASLFVVLALSSAHVIEAGARTNLAYAARQGPIALGSWQLDPPGTARYEGAFAGRPVHDDTAVFRVPIAVARDAAPGAHEVHLEVEAAISDGVTGRALGSFTTGVVARVVVGAPIGGRRTPVPNTPAGDVAEGRVPSDRAPSGGVASQRATAHDARAGDVTARASDETATARGTPASSGSDRAGSPPHAPAQRRSLVPAALLTALAVLALWLAVRHARRT